MYRHLFVFAPDFRVASLARNSFARIGNGSIQSAMHRVRRRERVVREVATQARKSRMSLRVTGGRLGGRRLRAPRSGMRPSSDRVRESLFARLGDLEGAAVLDLFAGTGALGIEALSRGAASLVSVERSRATVAVLRANVAALGLGSSTQVMADEVVGAVRRLGRASRRFDLVLLDPPYASGDASAALEALVAADLLAPGAVVVLERSKSHSLPAVAGLALLDERRYGDTVITRFTASAAEAEGPGAGAGGSCSA
jgi:16S rRNA (guanine966-N2)-methyltransferase